MQILITAPELRQAIISGKKINDSVLNGIPMLLKGKILTPATDVLVALATSNISDEDFLKGFIEEHTRQDPLFAVVYTSTLHPQELVWYLWVTIDQDIIIDAMSMYEDVAVEVGIGIIGIYTAARCMFRSIEDKVMRCTKRIADTLNAKLVAKNAVNKAADDASQQPE